MIQIKEILPSDSIFDAFEKINFNFNQIILSGGGLRGPKGDRGERGPQGAKGERGSKWFLNPVTTGSSIVLPEEPLLNDIILDKEGDVYYFNGTEWILSGLNLKGPKGDDGKDALSNGFVRYEGIQGDDGSWKPNKGQSENLLSGNTAPNFFGFFDSEELNEAQGADSFIFGHNMDVYNGINFGFIDEIPKIVILQNNKNAGISLGIGGSYSLLNSVRDNNEVQVPDFNTFAQIYKNELNELRIEGSKVLDSSYNPVEGSIVISAESGNSRVSLRGNGNSRIDVGSGILSENANIGKNILIKTDNIFSIEAGNVLKALFGVNNDWHYKDINLEFNEGRGNNIFIDTDKKLNSEFIFRNFRHLAIHFDDRGIEDRSEIRRGLMISYNNTALSNGQTGRRKHNFLIEKSDAFDYDYDVYLTNHNNNVSGLLRFDAEILAFNSKLSKNNNYNNIFLIGDEDVFLKNGSPFYDSYNTGSQIKQNRVFILNPNKHNLLRIGKELFVNNSEFLFNAHTNRLEINLNKNGSFVPSALIFDVEEGVKRSVLDVNGKIHVSNRWASSDKFGEMYFRINDTHYDKGETGGTNVHTFEIKDGSKGVPLWSKNPNETVTGNQNGRGKVIGNWHMFDNIWHKGNELQEVSRYGTVNYEYKTSTETINNQFIGVKISLMQSSARVKFKLKSTNHDRVVNLLAYKKISNEENLNFQVLVYLRPLIETQKTSNNVKGSDYNPENDDYLDTRQLIAVKHIKFFQISNSDGDNGGGIGGGIGGWHWRWQWN